MNESSKNKHLTKEERKQLKLQQNKEWMANYHSNGIEKKDLNEYFSGYYQLQLQECWKPSSEKQTSSDEWDKFINILKKPLPVTFRITERSPLIIQKLLFEWLKQYFSSSQHQSGLFEKVRWCLPSTFQLNFDNHTLLNDSSLLKLNSFLIKQVQQGLIVRQELVSMIPVTLLNLNSSSHIVLDCCAAPGSKTEQIVSKMHALFRKEQQEERKQRNSDVEEDERKKGFILANDMDQKRIKELANKFHSFPSTNLLFTNMNGEEFTSYFRPSSSSSSVGSSSVEVFDRILCDVPCSGDGTFRKAPHHWRLFRPRTGLSFHIIQRNILIQAIHVLKVNGRIVYSTCSLNPIEDEAVVASVLSHFQGKIRLLHLSFSFILCYLISLLVSSVS
jgi:16S rRNA C967 or C1407 C5-methylase (RsmB/RsmF family)